MDSLLKAAERAVRSIFSSTALGILLASMVLNGFILLLLILGISSFFSHTVLFDSSWLEMTSDWVGRILAGVIALFIFPLLLPLIISLFDEKITSSIEQKDYPHLSPVDPPFWPTLRQDVMFMLKAIGLNILIIPLYFIPVINLFIYYVLNGYLLGTEFFNVAAGRHVTREQAKQMRAQYRLPIIAGGMAIAFSSTLPFINLVTPLWGVAMMVHLFQIAYAKRTQTVTLPLEDHTKS